jgi:16S rRNA (cytosine967-C5)-methyltransferase
VSTQKPREIAFRVLQRRERSRRFVEDLLADELDRAVLPSADRSLAQELTYGVVRWEATLDWLIEQKARKTSRTSAPQILLRLGLYQLFWLERIPDHAAVNEAVALSKRVGASAQAGFINAILRAYIREGEVTRKLLADLRTSNPALGCSHPDWLFERWQKRWGHERAIKLMDWNNQPPEIFARVNTLRVQPARLLEAWKSEGVVHQAFERDWTGANLIFRVVSATPLRHLDSFKQGFFYIQDPSTLLAVAMLDPKPGERALDLCAAPGGKTTFIAQCMENRGHITAYDVAPQRLQMLRENCSRLGVACAEISLFPDDAENRGPAPGYDRAIVDAPCTNTGVIRRRVDLRWRLASEEIARLAAAQLRLLRSAGAQVKPGGVLIYSTCSVEPKENQQVTASFLSENHSFKLETERELNPHADGVDGAYVARFLRTDRASQS